jgi:ribosomal S17-like protein
MPTNHNLRHISLRSTAFPLVNCNCIFAAMATELTVQSERAFQKQPHIFLNSKTKSKKAGKSGRRWYKDVGLGFRTPKTAIEGTYIGTNAYRGFFSVEITSCSSTVVRWSEIWHSLSYVRHRFRMRTIKMIVWSLSQAGPFLTPPWDWFDFGRNYWKISEYHANILCR